MARKKLSSAGKLAQLRQKLDKTDMGGSVGRFWYAKEGRSTIRILPEVGDMDFFFQEVGTHQLGEDYKTAKKIYCPSYTSEGELPCPICEAQEVLYKQGKAGDKSAAKLAKMLAVKRKFWMNVIDRDNESVGPLIFTPGVMIMNALSTLVMDPDYGDVTDLLDGTDIIIEREGSGFDTEYQILPKRLVSPLHESDEQANEWMNAARDVSYVEVSEDSAEDVELAKGHAIWVHPYDRVQAEFDEHFGLDEDVEEEVEEPVKPARRTRRKTKTKVEEPVVEEEEILGEDDSEVDEVEAELETRRSRRVRRK